MRATLIASLLLSTITISTAATAAPYLAFDFYATGKGTSVRGSRVDASPPSFGTFDQFSGTLYYNLTTNTTPMQNDTGILYAGLLSTPVVVGQTKATGFDFRVEKPLVGGFISYNIAGSACYANSSPFTMPSGSYPLDPLCSQISVNYSDGFEVYGYDFEGTIQSINFRVIEANDIPDITFAIPEPSTWALMLAGFGMVGFAMRRRQAAFA